MLKNQRRQTTQVMVGGVGIGSDYPVCIQSMTNTDTADINATVKQVIELAEAGSELVRMTVANEAAAQAVPFIRDQLQASGISVPLVGDFHFNGHKLLADFPDCASALDKFRINPGNVGKGKRRDTQFASMIEVACQYDKPVRIGVNWGSLDAALLSAAVDENNNRDKPLTHDELVCKVVIQSALESARFAESVGLANNKIILSCKHSHVSSLISIYRQLAKKCCYPLHLGLTEAGMGTRGIVASVSALSVLLAEGIGDTIRLSLTPEPNGLRTQEVRVGCELLQSMGFRNFRPVIVSCPGCGRTRGNYFQALAAEMDAFVDSQLPLWKKTYPGIENLTIAVMGCVVNGPGESKEADIGISLPGVDESLGAPVYIDGERVTTLKGEKLADEMKQLLTAYIARRFSDAQ